MPTISTNDIRKGMYIRIGDEKVFVIVDFQHVKPGKGGAFMRMKIKNIVTKQTLDKTFKGEQKIEQVIVERKPMEFSYQDGDGYIFMTPKTYDEEMRIDVSQIEDLLPFLKEGVVCTVVREDGHIFEVELPASVELEITEAPPGAKGDTATNATKEVTLETGAKLQVPLFIELSEIIKVDTRTGTYLSRA